MFASSTRMLSIATRRFASSTSSSRLKPTRPIPTAASPSEYRSREKRLVYAMVAAPIAIYTSYVLFERLIMGKERKKLGVPHAGSEERNVGFIAGTEGAEAPGVGSLGVLSQGKE